MSETLIPPLPAADELPPVSAVVPHEAPADIPEAEIDHPHHFDWRIARVAWLERNRGELKQNLRDRLPTTEREFAKLWQAVETGIARTDVYRTTHELSNKHLVAGYWEDEPGVGALVPVSPADMSARRMVELRKGYGYNTLAGSNATLPHYVPWVGRAALAVFAEQELRGRAALATVTHAEARQRALQQLAKDKSLSLEIGGVGQAGNWEGTEHLDAIMAGLPDRLLAANPGLEVVPFSRDARRHYQFIPLREMEGAPLPRDNWTPGELEVRRALRKRPSVEEEQDADGHAQEPVQSDDNASEQEVWLDDWQFTDIAPEYAMVRRRRPVCDVLAPGGERVRIFKQSVGLLALNFLPTAVYEVAQLASEVYPDYDSYSEEQQLEIRVRRQQANALANVMCGETFEWGIRTHDPAVVPLSMQYIMKVKRPGVHDLAV